MNYLYEFIKHGLLAGPLSAILLANAIILSEMGVVGQMDDIILISAYSIVLFAFLPVFAALFEYLRDSYYSHETAIGEGPQ